MPVKRKVTTSMPRSLRLPANSPNPGLLIVGDSGVIDSGEGAAVAGGRGGGPVGPGAGDSEPPRIRHDARHVDTGLREYLGPAGHTISIETPLSIRIARCERLNRCEPT